MKAAVTGWAWRTPLGSDTDLVMARLWAGECAARPHAHLDGAPFRVEHGCPVPGSPAPSKHARFLRRMGLYALECGEEALARSGAARGERLGVFLGYGGLRAHWNDMMPALEHQRSDARASWERGLRLLHPFWMLQHLSNNVQAVLAATCGAHGDGVTCAGSNAGAQALRAAQRALAEHAVDTAIVVAHDTLLEPETLVELAARERGAATGVRCAPYGTRGAGFVPGEAAAAVVLERPADAGSRALCYVSAAAGADGSDENPSAPCLAEVVRRVLGPAREPLAVVDGAARAWPDLDHEERCVLGEFVDRDVPLCATQASFGQLGAAASIVQPIAIACALRARRLPPIGGLEEPQPGPLRPLVHAEATDGSRGLALATGAPGLAGAVVVEVP